MALEGSVKDFSVADILQLIAQQQKTGVLIVEHQDFAAEIYFLSGEFVEARSSEQTARLEEILLSNQLAPRDVIQRCAEKARQTLEPLSHVLLRDNIVKREVLERILVTQMYETLYIILQWREGTYRFMPQNVKTDMHLSQLPGLESMLLDVLRMIDEWPSIQAALPPLNAIIEKTNNSTDVGLDEDEAVIMRAIDGKKTVQEIRDGSIIGRYATCKILVDFLAQDYCRIAGERIETKRKPLITLKHAAVICCFSALLGLLAAPFFLHTPFPKGIMPFVQENAVGHSPLGRYHAHCAVQNVIAGLDLYFLYNKRYPDRLDDLTHAGVAAASDIRISVERAGCSYVSQGVSYELHCR